VSAKILYEVGNILYYNNVKGIAVSLKIILIIKKQKNVENQSFEINHSHY